MRNLSIPWPQKLPDDRPEVQWREEVLELFLDAIEAKIPVVSTKNTPKVIFSFIFIFLKIFRTTKNSITTNAENTHRNRVSNGRG